MLAAWRGGKRSSAGARELGNVPSAYSPHPGSTPLSERETETEQVRHKDYIIYNKEPTGESFNRFVTVNW